MIAVIDTNVPATANATDSEFPECVAACVGYLKAFLSKGSGVPDRTPESSSQFVCQSRRPGSLARFLRGFGSASACAAVRVRSLLSRRLLGCGGHGD